MKNSLHKKLLLGLLVIEIAVGPGVFINKVLAAETPTSNSLSAVIKPQIAISNLTNTGDNIKANVNNNSQSNTSVQNNNQANVNQSVAATANTGYNQASRNISIGGNAGMINTGNAAVNVQGVVDANNNTSSVDGTGNGTTSESYGTNTGDHVTTSNSSSATRTTAVQNGNKTTINQSANTSANTEGNVADRNISIGGQAGGITTGSASSNTNFLVTGNGSVTLIGGDSNGNGPGSGASIVRNLGSNNNNAFISQSCGLSTCFANTGDNTSNRGISRGGDAGVINTGDAQVNVLMYAIANQNRTGVNGANGSSSSQSDVVNTGDTVNTDNSASNQNATTVHNSNNATINQQVNADANTGRNTADRNISIGGNAGIINTGNAGVNVLMIADVNSNTTGILGNGIGSNYMVSGLGFVNTGYNSQAHSSNNSQNTNSVFNVNFADTVQNVMQWVNTGLNHAASNIGN